uniref:Uncharacterized protein n=1 Tax=Rhizophora mucronata TaxID=61149 RepID=A0A2P2P1G2_RHIMU
MKIILMWVSCLLLRASFV